MVLDCCHSGAFPEGPKAALESDAGAREAFAGTGYGRVILTASNALQYAWEGDKLLGQAEHSVFTHFLVQGLRTGAADLDADGHISLHELYDYVYDQVLRSGVTQQTPEMWAEKVRGEILIAWNPHLQRQKELERLYGQAQASLERRAWAEAVELCRRIQSMEAGYRDVDGLLAQAQAALEQEQAERERQAQLAGWYAHAQDALREGRWERARQLAALVQSREPGYRDVERLLGRAEGGLRRDQAFQDLQTQLATLYEQLQVAAAGEDWAEVLALGGRIDGLTPGYRDVTMWMDRARTRLSYPKAIPPTQPSAATRLRRQFVTYLNRYQPWSWMAGGGLVVLALVAIVLLLTRDSEKGTLGLLPTHTPTRAVAIATSTSTHTPRPTLTLAPPPTTTLTPSALPLPPTDTPTPTATPTPTPTPTPGPGDPRTRSTDGMVMVYVPGGTFQMGSDDGEGDEQPVHSVTLDSFWIDRTEVSVEQFRKFVTETGYLTEAEQNSWAYVRAASGWEQIESADWRHPQGSDSSASDDHPVVQVSWNDATAYCEWVEGRLPTEAEWEYAANGPDGSIYPWGDEFDCSRGNFDDEVEIDSFVISGGEGCDGYTWTAPVGSFVDGAGWCGALDMAGNVWEWVADWYDENYYDVSLSQNPTGPEVGEDCVLRGGSWDNYPKNVRSANRSKDNPNYRRDTLGFRCVVPPTSSLSE